MNKLQFDHEFLPVDIIINYNHTKIPPIQKEHLIYYAETFDDPTSIYRQDHVFSSFFSHAIKLKSEINTTKIEAVTNIDISLYRDSLPVLASNSLSVESSYEEAQTWLKLAIQLAHIARDTYSVINSTSCLISNYFYVGRDYANGMEELEKLILFEYGSLITIPNNSSNQFLRRFVQSQIIHNKSELIQLQKHKLANLGPLFYPGQLSSITIGM